MQAENFCRFYRKQFWPCCSFESQKFSFIVPAVIDWIKTKFCFMTFVFYTTPYIIAMSKMDDTVKLSHVKSVFVQFIFSVMQAVYFVMYVWNFEGTLKAVKKSGISCFETDKEFVVWMLCKWQNYLNAWVMTMNCVSKNEGHWEII
jgi:UDP-N-acetylmuramyl pentapeptide phosphotransferase/UDP-N-acetylglucosamine-1-phosphate transferase